MRMLRHLFARSAQAWFPQASMERITAAIDAGELRHAGEVCFAVEPALHWVEVLRGVEARARAEDAFARLRVWDTEANNGVLLYVLLADHRLEIDIRRSAAVVAGDHADSRWVILRPVGERWSQVDLTALRTGRPRA